MKVPLALSILFLGIASPAQVPSDLVERLHRADAETSLESTDIKPWHLKMSFELLGPKSAILDSGNIDEWWAPGRHRITINAKKYNFTEVVSDKGQFQTSDASSVPYPIDLLRAMVVRPMKQKLAVEGSVPELRQQAFGKASLDCIMLSQKIGVGTKGGKAMKAVVPLGLFPTYCFDQGKDTVRLISDLGIQTTVLNRIGRFQGRSVAIDLSTVSEGTATSRAHVDGLTSSTLEEGRYEDLAGLSPVDIHPILPSDFVVAGRLLTKPQPVYPESARADHLFGTVILHATIGRDGHIRDMTFAQVPSPDLAIAAMQAVRKWTYSPLVVNGKPVEVETDISVNFEMELR